MKNEKVIKLFDCCKLVLGKQYSILMDIQRKSYRRIPNQLANLVNNSFGKTIEQIKYHYGYKFNREIDENISILEKEEYIFFTDHPEWFPPMNMEWDEPTVLTNAIIDIDSENLYDFEVIWEQLSILGCEHIQMRSYNPISLDKVEKILNKIGSKRIISVELMIPYISTKADSDYIDFVYKLPRVFTLILHSAPENKSVFVSPTKMGHVFYSKHKIKSTLHCGKIGIDFFNIHIKSFTEALHHNTCLNRKISIDAEGNIKNCPSMKESFGNIKDTTLEEALNKPGFKKYWNIKKDNITKCKDCEFRYICTDCRAYIEEPDDIYSAPLKCGYDPYTGKWEEWSKNPLKEKAIQYYGMEGFLNE